MTETTPRAQIDRIREQFTRQRDAYIRQPDVSDDATADLLAAFAGAGEGTEALDVACGPGNLTRALARTGADVIGLDATDAFVEYARAESARAQLAHIRLQVGDAAALPFAEDAFDLITCRAAFHHFPEAETVFREMRRVLREDGRVVVADLVGSENPAEARAQHEVEVLCDPTHHRSWRTAELIEFAQSAGLGLVKAIESEISHDLEEWIEHGGPDAPSAETIRTRMRAWCGKDISGLRVREESGRIQFSHRTALLVFDPA